METVLTSALINSLTTGDIKGFVAYVAIFFLLWLQIRGQRKAIESLGKSIENLGESIRTGFSAGETRFEKIEDQIKSFEHRLTVIEQ